MGTLVSLSLSNQLVLRQEVTTRGELRQQTKLSLKAYDIVHFWDSQEKLSIELPYEGGVHNVEYVLAPPQFIRAAYDYEKFGFIVGNMIFISSEIAQQRPEWVKYIVLKLFAERFIPEGLDESGRVKHWSALQGMIDIARAVFRNELELYEFLSTTAAYETTRYFTLDQEVKAFLQTPPGSSSVDSRYIAKRAYLRKHHNNRFVTLGRIEEEIDQLGGHVIFVNYAERISRRLGRLAIPESYMTARFVDAMIAFKDGTIVEIEKPYTEVAYVLTKEINGLVDLVEFDEEYGRGVPKDLIRKVPGKQRTWLALSRRLSYQLVLFHDQLKVAYERLQNDLQGFATEAQVIVTAMQNQVDLMNDLSQAKEAASQVNVYSLRDRAQRLKFVSDLSTRTDSILSQIESVTTLLQAAV